MIFTPQLTGSSFLACCNFSLKIIKIRNGIIILIYNQCRTRFIISIREINALFSLICDIHSCNRTINCSWNQCRDDTWEIHRSQLIFESLFLCNCSQKFYINSFITSIILLNGKWSICLVTCDLVNFLIICKYLSCTKASHQSHCKYQSHWNCFEFFHSWFPPRKKIVFKPGNKKGADTLKCSTPL